MPLKKFARKMLSKRNRFLDALGRAGLRLYLYRENAHFDPDLNGEHWLLDTLKAEDFNPETIIDIGANEGRWSDRVKTMWPAASIHLFEPVASIAGRLFKRFEGVPNVHIHQMAVGGNNGSVSIHENTEISSHSFVTKDDTGSGTVKLLAGGHLTKQTGSDQIDLCKIDAEGFDLSIIRSIEPLLTDQKISVIQFEHHALAVAYDEPFSSISTLLESHGYRLGKLFPDGLREIKAGTVDWSNQVGPNFVAVGPSHTKLWKTLHSR